MNNPKTVTIYHCTAGCQYAGLPPGEKQYNKLTMEIKDLNKTDFKAIIKQNSKAARQFVIENGVMYEQVTVDNIQYRHKLLSVRPLSKEALDRKVQAIQPGTLPIRLKESAQGEVLALVCGGKTVLYYHLPISSKEQKARAQQMVYCYAKSLVAKAA